MFDSKNIPLVEEKWSLFILPKRSLLNLRLSELVLPGDVAVRTQLLAHLIVIIRHECEKVTCAGVQVQGT